jgi:hypothetical protein
VGGRHGRHQGKSASGRANAGDASALAVPASVLESTALIGELIALLGAFMIPPVIEVAPRRDRGHNGRAFGNLTDLRCCGMYAGAVDNRTQDKIGKF